MRHSLTIFLLSIFTGLNLQARILVVSDIDDTIKVSHVLSKAGAVSSSLDDYSHFVGMPELYQALALSNKENIEFHYVSLAPAFLMREQHTDFILENSFPLTQLHTNPGIKQDPELKQKVIRQLIRKISPELIIYFGDNGQFDTIVYDQMSKEFPEIPAITYIREAYSKLDRSKYKSKFPTLPGQIGFVTSAEVAYDLATQGLIQPRQYVEVENLVLYSLIHEEQEEAFGEMVFPWWQDCRDFVWRWNPQQSTKNFLIIKKAVAARCQTGN